MASGSSGSRGNTGGRRRGAQQRLTYRQMQTPKNASRQARRMRINRANNSIPF